MLGCGLFVLLLISPLFTLIEKLAVTGVVGVDVGGTAVFVGTGVVGVDVGGIAVFVGTGVVGVDVGGTAVFVGTGVVGVDVGTTAVFVGTGVVGVDVGGTAVFVGTGVVGVEVGTTELVEVGGTAVFVGVFVGITGCGIIWIAHTFALSTAAGPNSMVTFPAEGAMLLNITSSAFPLPPAAVKRSISVITVFPFIDTLKLLKPASAWKVSAIFSVT